jgi:hypothetical protein
MAAANGDGRRIWVWGRGTYGLVSLEDLLADAVLRTGVALGEILNILLKGVLGGELVVLGGGG